MFVKDQGLMTYLAAHFGFRNAIAADELDITVTTFIVDPAHRYEEKLDIERVTFVEGYDMSHIYDHYHGHHHEHK